MRAIAGAMLLARALAPASVGADVAANLHRLPLRFEQNRGQAPPDVAFLARAPGYVLQVTGAGLVVQGAQATASLDPAGAADASPLEVRFLDADPARTVTGEAPLAGCSHYFIGDDPRQWQTDVPHVARVRHRGLYPGIDVVFYGNQRRLEYDFIVAPGADPARIRLRLGRAGGGVTGAHLDAAGRLVLDTGDGALVFEAPISFQRIDGRRVDVASRFVLATGDDGAAVVTIALGDYDHGRELVIDPVLVYSGYYGGTGNEQPLSVAVDAAGNWYVTGRTASAPFPLVNAAVSTRPATHAPPRQVGFVLKLNAAGDQVIYSTYLEGSVASFSDCRFEPVGGFAIAADAAGNAYVTGNTCYTNFPAAVNEFGGGGLDGYVAKLGPGGALLWTRYLGGLSYERAAGIAVDASGNAYAAGKTETTRDNDFPTTPGSWLPNRPAVATVAVDGYAVKLTSDGGVAWSTYVGGGAAEGVAGIAIDSANPPNVFVGGHTESTDFPTTAGSYQPQRAGGGVRTDAFIVKLNPSGSAPVYSTYFGGPSDNTMVGFAVGPQGRVYFSGLGVGMDLPLPPSPIVPFDTAARWGRDYIAVLSESGSQLLYSTYFPLALSIAVRADGVAYVTGSWQGADFPFRDAIQGMDGIGCPGPCPPGAAFVSWIRPVGQGDQDLVFSTYLAGNHVDQGVGIAVDAAGSAYVVGSTASTDFPEAGFPVQDANAGATDLFLAKIAPSSAGPTATATNTATATRTATATITPSRLPTVPPVSTPTHTATATATHTASATATDTRTATRTATITRTPTSSATASPTVTPTPDLCGNGRLDVGEECDAGDENSDKLPNTCRTLCKLPRCGDGVTDDGPPNDEGCDDGNREDDDGCPQDCKLGIQLRPFLVVGLGLCSNPPVDIEVREVPSGQLISADDDIEYQWIRRGPDAGTLENAAARVLEAAVNRFIAAAFRAMGRGAPPNLPIATMTVRKVGLTGAQVVFADGEPGYGINVLRAVRKRDGKEIASNIALVVNGLKLDGENALDIEPVSPLNVAGQAVTSLFGSELEDPPMILFSGGLLCDGSGTFPAGTGLAKVKSITFNLFGGRIKDVDLFDAVQKVIGLFPAARGPLAVLGQAASLGRGAIASQFLDFEVSSKAAMDAEEQSGRTQTMDDVISVTDELSASPPFFKGIVTAKAPGISAVQATLDLERYCMGKSDDSFLVLVGPRLEKTEIRNETGRFESPMRVPLNGTRQPHAVALLNGIPPTGPVTIAFDPIDATGDRVTEFRNRLTRLIPGADQALNEISGSVQMTVPPGAMLDPVVGLYRNGDTFVRIKFTYKPFEGTITIDELKIQIPVPNIPIIASWQSIAPPDPVVSIASPQGTTTGLKRGMGEIKVDVCLPLFNVADPATRMATLPVIVVGEEIIIAGRKFDDSNGNGQWDEGEPFLRGWTIEITDAFGAVVASEVTNEDGNYLIFVEKEKFPKDTVEFGVREVPQPGWSATDSSNGVRKGFRIDSGAENVDFGNFRDLDLSGVKFHDRDGDGVRGVGEEGLANWIIEITDGSGRVHRKFTDPDGRYEISLPFDFFRGGLPITVRELPQSRWTATIPKGGGPVEIGGLDSGLRSGFSLGVNFGNFHDVRVEGRKFEDANGNGLQNPGEDGLRDWTIELVDSFGQVRRTMTDSDGDYFFRLPLTVFKGPLKAKVREVQQPGWVRTFPGGDGTHGVPIGPLLSDQRYQAHFGNRRTEATATPEATDTVTETPGEETETPTPTATGTRTPANILTGVKYEDLNGNGRRDVNEPRLRDWVIFLDDNLDDVLNNDVSGDGVCDQHAEEECKLTDVAGVYAFVIGSGLYRVREVQQPGWVQSSTNPPDVFVKEDGGLFPLLVYERAAAAAVRVSLSTGPQSFQFLDFGNFRLGNVPGVKFEDRNGDGRQDATEPGLAGWTIYDDTNENARLDAGEVSVETGRDGVYLFRGLRAGRHVLREVPRCGYRQTLPGGSGSYVIDAASGEDLGVRDFGNQPPAALPGDGNRDGRVSAADLVATTNGLRGGRQHALMDANEDGRIDAADLGATGANLFACGGLTAPVAPLATLTPTRGTPATTAPATATPTRSAVATSPPPTAVATATPTAPVATPTATSLFSPSRSTTRTVSPTPTPSATAPTGSPTPGSAPRCRELPPAPIPDGDEVGLDDVLSLNDATVIADLNVRLKIDHSFVGDLIATLTHLPSGTQIVLLNQPGSGGGGFGCDADDVDVLLDDEAGSPVQDACAEPPPAIGGTLRPPGGLDAFDGETLSGEWHLTVSDLASSDEGALVRWCLEVNGGGQPAATPTPTAPPGALRQCFQPPAGLEIPDGDLTGATADVVVTSAVPVNDLNVSLDIAHTWVGDLAVQLSHLGSGRSATLIDRPGVPLSGGGCDQPDIVAVLDDEAPSAAEDQCDVGPAISGSQRPAQALGLFDGIDAAGTWRLRIVDNAAGDVGVLQGWCLGVNRSP